VEVVGEEVVHDRFGDVVVALVCGVEDCFVRKVYIQSSKASKYSTVSSRASIQTQ